MIKVAILTVSDSSAAGKREDLSGPAIRAALPADSFEVCEYGIVPDDRQAIEQQLVHFADELKVDIVLTTGGTGLGPRDVTPEATAEVCQRPVPGLAEVIRAEGLKKTRNAMLSRGTAGLRSSTLIINLPGSPKAVTESLEAIVGVLPHATDMMLGGGH